MANTGIPNRWTVYCPVLPWRYHASMVYKGDEMGSGTEPGKAVEKSRKKGRWFQFHLSTAILILMSLSIVVWLNAPRTYIVYSGGDKTVLGKIDTVGWPFETYLIFYYANDIHSKLVFFSVVAKDAISCGALVTGVGCAYEYIIRRAK